MFRRIYRVTVSELSVHTGEVDESATATILVDARQTDEEIADFIKEDIDELVQQLRKGGR